MSDAERYARVHEILGDARDLVGEALVEFLDSACEGDDELRPAVDAGKAEKLGLDLMIDDSPEVLARMPAGTARMWLCDPEIFDLDVCARALRG